jgi:serine phosphatase RsbU (regulator of sigma subunit)
LKPHEALSGDWVKWHEADSKALFVLGDVVGKGISAALTHSGIASIWDVQTRLWETSQIPMREVIDAINRTMFKLYDGAMNTTFAIAEVAPDGKADLAAAGHFWLHLSNTGCRPIVAQSSSPLGIRPDIKINKTSIQLVRGDWLVSFSDGVIEGNRAVKKFLTVISQQAAPLSAESIRNLLIETGKSTVKDDDATVLILRYDAEV